MTRLRSTILILMLLPAGLAGCDALVNVFTDLPEEPPIDNPLDPDPGNPNFVPPNTNILSPSGGSTFSSASVNVTCQGNQGVVAFQDSLAGGSWSAWSSQTSRTIGPLDEGSHTIFVRGAYDTTVAALIDDTPASVTFTVNAVQGTSLRFSPPYIEGGLTGNIDLALVAEDVSNLMMVKAVFTFDPSVITLNSGLNDWSDSEFLSGNGGSVLSFYEVDNAAGRFEINLSVVEGDPAGVSGTGTLLNLTFSGAAAGLSSLTWVESETVMRDHSNQPISIVNLVGAQVRVK
ncbi:cohesin domain-containing protein [Gemmatimonadota bacterium]